MKNNLTLKMTTRRSSKVIDELYADENDDSSSNRLKERVSKVYEENKDKHEIMKKTSFVYYLIFFIILAIILYLIFFFFKFPFVQNRDLTGTPTGEINQGKAVGFAVVISLIVTVLAYLLMVPKNRW